MSETTYYQRSRQVILDRANKQILSWQYRRIKRKSKK